MKVSDFPALADELKDNGYPEKWVNQELIRNMPMYAKEFSITGLMKEKGDQVYVKLDFDISSGRIELKEMTGLLLKPEFKTAHTADLNHPLLAEKWIQEKYSSDDIVPAFHLYDTLRACREMSRMNPDLVEQYKTTNHYTMNRNSLENFWSEARALKVPEKMIAATESMMEQGIEKFTVQGQIPTDKGMMDLTIHMKKSGQSDFYYFNRFDIAHSKAKPLEKEHQYMVITANEPGKKPDNLIRKFDSPVQAMDFFRDQKGNSELATGKVTDKDLQYRDTVATMKDGKVDYVKKEFQQTFYSPALKNSHYIDRGKGYTIEQAANMLQGRAVFRDDMVSRAGEQYKAWSTYQFDQPKDKYGNYAIKQFGEGYGFDLKKELSGYEIKELYRKETTEKLITDLQNGNKPVITVLDNEGKDQKLRIEAVPRYTNLNFFELGGKPVKREDYRIEQELGNNLGKDKSKSKDKNKEQENELAL